MATMKAVALGADGPVDVELAKPYPSGRDLLVQVHAIAVNPVDTKVPAITQGDGQPRVLGWDVAGVVEEVGPDCSMFKPGDAVYYAGDITRPGGNSEYHLVDERIVGRKPRTLDFAEAAALPLTSITAWEGLFHRLGLNPDGNPYQTVLIVGAAGGVGSIATQLARHAGLTVIGTASRPESREWALQHGAHHIINHNEAFLPQLQSLGYDSVEYVFCLNAVDSHWENMLSVLVPQGRLCTILPPFAPVNFRLMSDKSITWTIEAMFTRPKYRTPDMVEQHKLLNKLADWIDEGKIQTTLRERLSPINAENLRIAFDKLKSGHTIGKIVLESFR